jgi:2-polyprenyl-3-methyl-5-hydroxy-6-metoxy-1,4-benzoquinol methylase
MYTCPLCDCEVCWFFHGDNVREYLCCRRCGLVFVPQVFQLNRREEKAVYDLHENGVNDIGYRKYLARLSTPLLHRLGTAPRHGLDFGCGPGPALAAMLAEHGHTVELYDPFYFDNPAVLAAKYDFVCATEVVEHFRDPKMSFSLMFNILANLGILAVMTGRIRDQESFKRWHYIRDPTHVSFYSEKTFAYLAEKNRAELEFVSSDVVFFVKQTHLQKKWLQ